MTKPKLSILGHGGHGKDTVAEILRDDYGFKLVSASRVIAEWCVIPALPEGWYTSVEDCFRDRRNHRKGWFSAVRNYTRDDPARLVCDVLHVHGSDIYTGHRNRSEYEASEHLFDYTVFVDASERLPAESADTMELGPQDADYVLHNNGDAEELTEAVRQLVRHMQAMGVME